MVNRPVASRAEKDAHVGMNGARCTPCSACRSPQILRRMLVDRLLLGSLLVVACGGDTAAGGGGGSGAGDFEPAVVATDDDGELLW